MIQRRLVAAVLAITISGLAACKGTAAAPPAPAAAPPATAPVAAPVATTGGPVAQAGAPQNTATGTVAETMNSGGYTYIRLKTATEEIWVAATELPIKVGERITVTTDMPMRNYHSRTLNRDFPVVYFVPAVAREGETLPGPQGQPGDLMMGGHQSASTPVTGPAGPVAPAAGGLAIADVWARRKALAGTSVIVRGRVVKVNNGIMDRNWVHLQDGSGSEKEKTNDLTVTTSAAVSVGDVVTMTGVLAIAKDFGAGYAYDAILEQATVTGK
jgi:hypothetical protein